MTTADEQAAFLTAICADPGDVGLRLIYADWLDDHGQEVRSEFIHVQCELVGMRTEMYLDPDDHADQQIQKRLNDLRRRERELWLAGRAYWGRDVPGHLGDPTNTFSCWRRGFVENISCTCVDWLAHGPTLVRAQPVLEVKLSEVFHFPTPIVWARGPHPERGLEALPPLEDKS